MSIFHGHVKFHDEEEREWSTGNVREQNFPDCDLMSFVDVGPVVEISVDIGKSVDVVSSEFVDSVGTEGRLQNVVGTEDGKQVFLDMRSFLDMTLCDQSMNVIFAVGIGGHSSSASSRTL